MEFNKVSSIIKKKNEKKGKDQHFHAKVRLIEKISHEEFR